MGDWYESMSQTLIRDARLPLRVERETCMAGVCPQPGSRGQPANPAIPLHRPRRVPSLVCCKCLTNGPNCGV